MHYVNASSNAKVTRYGILYPNFQVDEDGYVNEDHYLIPFVGFDESEMIELENGSLLLLSQFELQKSSEGSYVLTKGDGHNGFCLVMYSFFYEEGALLYETPLGPPPEHSIRFVVRRDLESPIYHEYLFVIHKSKTYHIGYHCENKNVFLHIELSWDFDKDELRIKVYNPFPKNGF